MPDVVMYYNQACSKCRTAEALLADSGVNVTIVRYLDRAPTVEELRRLMQLLGIDDPRAMLRRGEAAYTELDLDAAGDAAVLEAVTRHPILLERPIVVCGDRAVIARPPERLFELIGDPSGGEPGGTAGIANPE